MQQCCEQQTRTKTFCKNVPYNVQEVITVPGKNVLYSMIKSFELKLLIVLFQYYILSSINILFAIGQDSWQKKCRSVTKYKYTYETKVITGTAILQDKKCFPDVKQTCVQLRVPTYRVISKFDLSYKYISLY